MNWTKKNIGEILLIIGIGIFIFNIFGISHYHQVVSGSRYYVDTWYAYSSARLSGLAIGAMIIIASVAILKSKQK